MRTYSFFLSLTCCLIVTGLTAQAGELRLTARQQSLLKPPQAAPLLGRKPVHSVRVLGSRVNQDGKVSLQLKVTGADRRGNPLPKSELQHLAIHPNQKLLLAPGASRHQSINIRASQQGKVELQHYSEASGTHHRSGPIAVLLDRTTRQGNTIQVTGSLLGMNPDGSRDRNTPTRPIRSTVSSGQASIDLGQRLVGGQTAQLQIHLNDGQLSGLSQTFAQ